MECEGRGTFIGCHGDGRALWFKWRGCRICRGCLVKELDGKPVKKFTARARGYPRITED